MFRFSCCYALVALSLIPGAGAQEKVLFDYYGLGVHSYFSNDDQTAYDRLTLAIDSGFKDPRAYYFRGIAASRQGRLDEAKVDFEEGARIEAMGAELPVRVGKALERIQGSLRSEIEEIRRRARLNFLNESRERRRQRQGGIENSPPMVAPETVRPGPAVTVPPTTPPTTPPANPPANPPEVLPADPNTTNPFNDEGATDPGTTEMEDASTDEPEAEQEGNDPFN